MRVRTFGIVFVVAACSVAACGSSSKSTTKAPPRPIVAPTPSSADPAPFPAPSDPMARTREAGLVPETTEQFRHHVHSHLDVFVDGKHVLVPAGIGIDTKNPRVHRSTILGMPAYGGISVACDDPCISPLHTHDITGIVHTESSSQIDNTLGQFLTEWNPLLDATCVGSKCELTKPVVVFVNGTRFDGDPATIPLTDRKEIAIIVGSPPAEIPTTADWTQI